MRAYQLKVPIRRCKQWSMATKYDVEEYDKRLQQLMQDCLPSILVDVVEQRPRDPIAFMAHSLYKYRNRDPIGSTVPSDTHRNTQRNAQPARQPVFPTNTDCQSVPVSKTNRDYAIVQGLDEFDDAVCDMDTLIPDIRSVHVHLSFFDVYKNIGDLYDDDDIS